MVRLSGASASSLALPSVAVVLTIFLPLLITDPFSVDLDNPGVPLSPSFRIFDLFLYHNEAHMLLLRLRTLAPYVTKHYIGFSPLSFSHSVHAALSFSPFCDEIATFSGRFFWFNYTHPSTLQTGWRRESDIRLRLLSELTRVDRPTPSDLVIWSDLDEIPLPRGMRWVIRHPPAHHYRFAGPFHFYNYRWRSPVAWDWAYVMRCGAIARTNMFRFRFPHPEAESRIPGPSAVHCSYCFPSMRMIVTKLRSFSHTELAREPYVNVNFIYAHVYCGESLFGGKWTSVNDLDWMELDFPNDSRYDFMRKKLMFDDIENITFNAAQMARLSPCALPFLADQTAVKPPHFLSD